LPAIRVEFMYSNETLLNLKKELTMTITISTDPIVFAASTTKLVAKAVIINKMQTVKANRQEKKYDRKIRKSQKKLAETKLVPGYTRIYA
jgi:hypothetical protein